jgi:uncharacterized membrane protein YiaA
MKRAWSELLLAVGMLLTGVLLIQLERRVETLEKICHGLCKYGDSACAKRCADAGHCPMQQ